MLVSPTVVGAADNLQLQTLSMARSDRTRIQTISSLAFGTSSALSQGTTLEKGTVIMTGTPAGVAMGMKPSPRYLNDGDVVEVRIQGLGSCKNRMVFE
jgi:2-keto-4-pentenoate hydratase